jgi:diacylglycerol kinase (ATP)
MNNMRAILILNPTSGSSAFAAHHESEDDLQGQIIAALQARDIETEVWYTTLEDAGTDLARRAVAEGVDIVIAAGGDGTLHAVASGLIKSNSVLGIIPVGTMNNVAHSLQIPEDIEQACEIIAKGHTRQIDVGSINGNIFLEVAGIGLEAALFPAAEEIKAKGLLSTVRGIFDGLKALFVFQPSRFTISFDQKQRRRVNAVQISICNSPYYGAHLRFAPKARMDDGFLDILIYRNFSKFAYLLHAASISQGRRILEPRVSSRKIKTVSITSEQPVVVHVDGEQKGTTPVEVQVEPGVLQVRVPESLATSANLITTKAGRTRRYQQTQATEIPIGKDLSSIQ